MSRSALSRAERQLVLISAGTAASRRTTQPKVGKLLADVNWARLARTLRMRKLLPILGPRISDLAADQTSEDFERAVGHALDSGRRQAGFIQLVAERALTMLADAGISSTSLKGPSLSEAIHGDPGRRVSDDVDLLVAPDQLDVAVDVLRELGYQAPADYVDRSGLPLLHFALLHERGYLPPIELHWRIHWYEPRFAEERLLPPRGMPVASNWRPAPHDELAALLLFYARDGFVDLRLASDLSGWWDVRGATVPRGALDDVIRSYPALARAITVAAQVADTIVGIPANRVLTADSSLGVRGRLAGRLANPNPRTSQSQLYAEMGLIDGLLAPPREFRAFLRRQVLLPEEILGALDRHSPKRRKRSSLTRGVGIVGRYGIGLARAARAPETMR